MILDEGSKHQTGDHSKYQVIQFEASVGFSSTPLCWTGICSL